MASPVHVKFEEICRTCMGCSAENPEDKTFQLQSIFDYVDVDEKRRIKICDILNFCVQKLPNIDINDEMPNNICTRCLDKLYACYEFQNGCITSDLRLRHFIETSPVVVDSLELTEEPLVEKSTLQFENDADKIQAFRKHEFPIDENYIEVADNMYDFNIENFEIDDAKQRLQDSFNDLIEQEMKTEIIESPLELYGNDNNVSNETNQRRYKRVWECKNCFKCFPNRKLLANHFADDQGNCKEENEKTTDEFYSTPENDVQTSTKTFVKTNSDTQKQSIAQIEGTKIKNKSDMPNFKTWICKICEKSFSYKRSLKRHMQLIHDVVELTGETSSDNFFEKISLNSSTQKCNKCDQVFQSLALLKLHKFTHKDPSPFKCKFCNRSFRSGSYLKEHELTHSKNDLFICLQCAKSFHCVDDLRQHALLHEAEKRFECFFCKVKFNTYSAVRNHHKSQHKNSILV